MTRKSVPINPDDIREALEYIGVNPEHTEIKLRQLLCDDRVRNTMDARIVDGIMQLPYDEDAVVCINGHVVEWYSNPHDSQSVSEPRPRLRCRTGGCEVGLRPMVHATSKEFYDYILRIVLTNECPTPLEGFDMHTKPWIQDKY